MRTTVAGGFTVEMFMCLEATDLTTYFSCSTDSLCCSESYIQNKLDAALELVDAITGQNYCSESACYILKGNGTDTIFLTDRTSVPLTSLTSVSIREDSDNCDDWEVISTDYIEVYPRAIRYCNDIFPCRDVKICGDFGDTMPAGYKDIVYTLAMEMIKPGIMQLTPNRVTREDYEDTSKSWQQDYTLMKLRASTGYAELDSRLQAYINPFSEIGFSAIEGCDDCTSSRAPKRCE